MLSNFYRLFVSGMILTLLGVFYYMDHAHQEGGSPSDEKTIFASTACDDASSLEKNTDSTIESRNALVVKSEFAQRILDQFADVTVVDAIEVIEPDGIMVRKEVMLTEMKYPLIRREIHFQIDESNGEWIPIEGYAYVADQVMMGLKEGETLQTLDPILDQLDAEVLQSFEGGNHFLLKFKTRNVESVEQVINTLRLYSVVDFAEPNYLRLSSYIPNDPRFNEMWALNNYGQRGGLPDADIDVAEAWGITFGERSVIVAVTDTGIDKAHPDLSGSIYQNPGEILNGVDDDGNGYVDDVAGWNFAGDGIGNNDPQDDSGSHGTHVSGTIAATGDNNQGVIGVCPGISLLPLKVLDENGGFVSDFIRGINYAVSMGATVINVSLGGSTSSQSEQNAISNAEAAGVLIVVASGNEGKDVDSNPDYPSGYTNSNILSVLATNRMDQFEAYSSYGVNVVDVAAPGTHILSTYINNQYLYFTGTSMAAAHVSGVAALVKSVNSSWEAPEIRQAILSTVDLLPSLKGRCGSGGRVNAFSAVRYAADRAFFPSGSQITIRSNTNQRYVNPAPGLDNCLIANGTKRGANQIFDIFKISPGRYAFRSFANKQFVTAEAAGADDLAARRMSVGDWEQFTPIQLSQNTYAFRANANGKIVTAENVATEPLIANRDGIGGWEEFVVEAVHPLPPGRRIVLQSATNGQFVSLNGLGQLIAQDAVAGLSNIFTVGLTQDGYISLKANINDRYVSAENVGTEPLIANRTTIGDWEKFIALYHSEGQILLRSKVNNKFVSSLGDGNSSLIADRIQAGGWEVFNVLLIP